MTWLIEAEGVNEGPWGKRIISSNFGDCRPCMYSLSEFPPVVAVTDEQDTHTPAHDVPGNTSRSIRRCSCLLLQEFLGTESGCTG
jgi:hypothetical protein